MNSEARTVADIVGPWKETEVSTGLVERCRNAWNKPISLLSNEELATLLRQKIAVDHLIPIAKKRIAERFEDGTELYEEELENAVSCDGAKPDTCHSSCLRTPCAKYPPRSSWALGRI